jgi:integrase
VIRGRRTNPSDQQQGQLQEETLSHAAAGPAQRVLKGSRSAGRVFPSLPETVSKAGRRDLDTHTLERKLVALGAPDDFTCHALRHTLATWLQTAGDSEWEVGLVLNHAGSGSVTAGYSHGYPLDLKRQLLSKWADHVERLVQPRGAALLR